MFKKFRQSKNGYESYFCSHACKYIFIVFYMETENNSWSSKYLYVTLKTVQQLYV